MTPFRYFLFIKELLTMMKVKVENMVACITLDTDLDLKKIAKNVPGVENPKSFPGLIYRLKDLKVAFLIFRTGKLICSGSRTRSNIDNALEILLQKLRKAGVKLTGKPKVEVVNMVSSASMDFKVNLDTIALESWNVEYEPEQFPGLVYRLDDLSTVMLIFRSGKIIITGATSKKQAEQAAEKTKEMVLSLNASLP